LKIFLYSEDHDLATRVCTEATRMSWKTKCVNTRDGISHEILQYDADLLIVEISCQEDMYWWKYIDAGRNVPVIFLSFEISEEFTVTALECGADAVMPKTHFSNRYFEAQVQSLMRRHGLAQHKRSIARFNLSIDSEQHCIEINGRALNLTMTQFKILRELACSEEKIVPRLDLLRQVYGWANLNQRSLDVHVCSIRKHLKIFAMDIISVRGVGYRLVCEKLNSTSQPLEDIS
jgi:DNA-binding response OmpR family regulator